MKPGVEFATFAPAGMAILQAFKDVASNLNVQLMITSGTDGVHSGPDDPHRRGEAYDLRSHDFDPVMKQRVLNAIMYELGPAFFGYLEKQGKPDEHYHFQPRKGTTFTIEDFFA